MALTKTPIELSSTPSIVDNSNATAITIDSSENVLVNTANAGASGLSLSNGSNLSFAEGANSSIANLFRQTSSAAAFLGSGYRFSATANKAESSYASSWARTAISVGYGAIKFYADAAATVAVGTDITPTERLRILSTGGITFNGDTAQANALDDYEEGAFSTVSTGVNASGYGPSMRYTKIGRVVNILARVTWTGTSTSQALRFTLPFATPSTAATATGAVFYGGTSLKSGAALSCYVGPSTNEVYFYSTAGGSFNQLTLNEVNGSYDFLFSFTYETDL